MLCYSLSLYGHLRLICRDVPCSVMHARQNVSVLYYIWLAVGDVVCYFDSWVLRAVLIELACPLLLHRL